MNGLLPDADFLSLLCSCAHLLAIEGNEVLILDLFWQSLAFQVKDSPDLYSILKIKRMNLCMLTECFVYSQPAPEDMLTGTASDIGQNQFPSWHTSGMTYAQDFSTFFIKSG